MKLANEFLGAKTINALVVISLKEESSAGSDFFFGARELR